MKDKASNPKYVFVGGMMVGKRLCRRFTEVFESELQQPITLYTFRDAMNQPEEFKAACKNAIVVTHSAGNVLLNKYEARPQMLVAISPPNGAGWLSLSFRLQMRELQRVFRHDSILRGWYNFTPKQLSALHYVPRFDLASQLDDYDSWMVITVKDDKIFRPKHYTAKVRRSKDFKTVPGHHESIFFEPGYVLDYLRKLT